MRKCVLIVLCLFLQMHRTAVGEGLQFTMIDVGMAECMIVTCGSETMVIDTAYIKDKDIIKEKLEEMDVDSIKYLVLTHPHADHISGTRWLIDAYEVGAAILPPIEYGTEVFNKTIDALRESEVDLIYPYPGDQFHLDDAVVTVYGPHPVAYTQENDWSIVLMIEYAGKKILLTGDSQIEAEIDMLSCNDWLPLQADILKVAHHGSNTSSSFEFIEAVSPQYAIISCGKNNEEYPHVETAMTLMDCGVSDIITTEKVGDIHIQIHETGSYMISGQRMEQFILVK